MRAQQRKRNRLRSVLLCSRSLLVVYMIWIGIARGLVAWLICVYMVVIILPLVLHLQLLVLRLIISVRLMVVLRKYLMVFLRFYGWNLDLMWIQVH